VGRLRKQAPELRSWVQIPPGPLFNVMKLRYYFEFILISWRTNSAALVMNLKPQDCIAFDGAQDMMIPFKYNRKKEKKKEKREVGSISSLSIEAACF
jgi:hypothetical protein